MTGIKKEDIYLDYKNDSLIISVEQHEETNETKEVAFIKNVEVHLCKEVFI